MTSRPYLAMIQNSVHKDGVRFEEISANYLYRARQNDKSFIMHDVEVGLNRSSSSKLACSKSGTFSVLHHTGIPAIEHHFLLNPSSRFSKIDPYELAINYFHTFNESVVLKQDDGSQGENVFKITTLKELETHLHTLFSLQVNASLAPFYESTFEYRIIVLRGEAKLFLAKERTTSWKHNLIGGSLSKNVSSELVPLLSEMARNTAHALGLEFCSVDILDTTNGLRVLEINDQVMLDEYIKGDPSRKEKVSAIYREAILNRFQQL